MMYDVEVMETVVIHKLYKVEAESEDEAYDKASIGDTEEEYKIKDEGVINREVVEEPKAILEISGE